jgi:hypothetical protein
MRASEEGIIVSLVLEREEGDGERRDEVRGSISGELESMIGDSDLTDEQFSTPPAADILCHTSLPR